MRAFGDEPVRLRAIGLYQRAVEVIGTSRAHSIGYPMEHVFEYDKRAYAKLRQAYEAGDNERLATLWTEAKRFQTIQAP